MTIRQRLIAPILAIVWAATSGPVAADCDPAGLPDEVLPTAQVAFVGRLVSVDGPLARFAVGEVWAGEVGKTVEVHGMTRQIAPNQVGEDDRQWTDGATYLVIPVVDGPVLRDHICSATTEWTEELAALRPADAREIVPDAREEGFVSIGFIIFVVTLVAVVGISLIAFRRRPA